MQVTKQQRDHAKAMAYGLLYGLGKDRLAAKMEVTPQEAAQKSADFRASIPVLVRCGGTMPTQTLAVLLLPPRSACDAACLVAAAQMHRIDLFTFDMDGLRIWQEK